MRCKEASTARKELCHSRQVESARSVARGQVLRIGFLFFFFFGGGGGGGYSSIYKGGYSSSGFRGLF